MRTVFLRLGRNVQIFTTSIPNSPGKGQRHGRAEGPLYRVLVWEVKSRVSHIAMLYHECGHNILFSTKDEKGNRRNRSDAPETGGGMVSTPSCAVLL